MSTSVDNRIVKMQFDNATFKKEALSTKSHLEQVDAAISKTGNSKGLLSLGSSMQTVAVKASAMQVAAVTAIANIANRAVNAGINIAKSLTLDPLKAGFDEYELKMKSIQTILANTKGESLKTVTAALNELNRYADKTVYNFGNMTDAIGKMTTAGIDLKTATATVKGFHNMVALAGGDSSAAAGALEQFNQGLQAGVIKLMDWKSLQTRGLGSMALQKSFFETAKAAGTLKGVGVDTTFEQWKASVGGFNASLESGWLTADVASKAYEIMTGDIKSVEQLMKQGFSRQAAEDMIATAESAVDSATKVRTFSAFMDTTKEALGSGWSQVMETIFGDFNEATNLFTSLSKVTGNAIGSMFDGINALIGGWDKLGGRAAIFTTIQHILAPFGAIFSRIAEGFNLAFGGGKGGSLLATFSKALEHLTRPLNLLSKLIRGQITPLEFFWRLIQVVTHGIRNFGQFIGGIIKPLTDLVGIKLPSGNGIFAFFDRLVGMLKDAGKQFEKLRSQGKSVMDSLGGINISMPKLPGLPDIPKLPGLPDIGSMFGGGEKTAQVAGLTGGIKGLAAATTDLATASKDATSDGLFNPKAKLDTSRVHDATDAVSDLGSEVETVGDKATPMLQGFWNVVKDFFSGFNAEDLMASFNLAVLSTFMISISRFFNTLSKSFEGFVGVGAGVQGVLEGAQGALKGFADGKRAQLITAYAIAIGVLAVSLWLLSRIPMDKMVTGLAGMAGIMLIMKVGIGGIADAVDKMDGKGTPLKLTGLSLALLALGFAVLTLSLAFLILEKVDWSAMLKGLATIIVVMKTMEMMGKVGKGGAANLLATSVALGALAISFVILAGALLLFQLVKWEAMAKAGLVLAAITISLIALSAIPSATLTGVAAAMISISAGMLILANALLIFQLVKWSAMLKAGIVLAALTAAVAALMYVGGGPVGAASILGIAAAMVLLAGAGLMLNKVEWSSIGKIALILGVLVIGFAAFLAVITFFAPALIMLSAFAGSIALLALALTGLMLAFALIMPLLAIGTGAFAAFATGAAVAIGVFLTTLALQAPIMKKSILTIMQTAIDTIVEAVPMIIDGFKRLWAAIKAQFTGGGSGGPKGVATLAGKSGDSWMTKITDAIKKKLPEIVDKAVEIGGKFIDGLTKKAPAIAAKGVSLIVGLINGIASKVGALVSAAVDLVVKFAAAFGNNVGKITDAGVQLIADFLHALANTIRNGAGKIGNGIKDVGDAFYDVGVNIMQGLINGIRSLAAKPKEWIESIVGDLPGWAKKLLGIHSPSRVFMNIGKYLVEGLTKGIQVNASSAITSVASMVSGTIAVAGQYVDEFVQKLDQQAIAAAGKAAGLQAAAEKAAKAAEKTKKNQKDDRAANQLQAAADKAATLAEKRQAASDKAREASDRAAEFDKASLIDKAQMRADDATNTLDEAKAAEFEAESKRQEAAALRAQANKKGVSNKDAKEFRKQAEKLEEQARKDAQHANDLLALSRTQATEAMNLQGQAAAEAAAQFRAQYDAEAKADAEEDAYNKMSDEEKAVARRKEAAALQAKADADLARAQTLAYSNLDAANDLASEAMDMADKARDYNREAADLEKKVQDAKDSQSTSTGGSVVNLDPTEAAAIALGDYADLYNAAYAAAAGSNVTEFNQYNSSPEALDPTTVYRQTNNLFDWSVSKLNPPT